MDGNDLIIFDPLDVPFGPLSPNFPKPLQIGEKTYRSVSNYVYSQILKIPTYKNYVATLSNTRNIKNITMKLYEETLETISKTALDRALLDKFKIPQYRDALLATGNAVLVYRSNNTELGVNDQGIGKNILGEKLMYLRDLLTIEYDKYIEQQKQDIYFNRLYEAFIANSLLENLIRTGSSDLNEYIAVIKNPSQILDDFGREKALKEGLSFFAVMELFRKGLIEDYILMEPERPGNLAVFLRAKYLDKFVEKYEFLKKYTLLNAYFDYVLRKKFPNRNDYEKIKTRELMKLPHSTARELADRLYALYENGVMYPEIAKIMNEYPPIPTSEEIKDAKDQANILRGQKPTEPELELEDPMEEIVEAQALAEFIRDRMKDLHGLSKREILKKLGVSTKGMERHEIESLYATKKKELKKKLKKEWNKRLSNLEKEPYLEQARQENKPQEIVIEFERQPDEIQPMEEELGQMERPIINFGENIPEFRLLSPSAMLHPMIRIDHQEYPSVSHYVLAAMMTVLSYVKNIVQAHKYLLIDVNGPLRDVSNYKDIGQIDFEFNNLMSDDIATTILGAVNRGLNEKFQDDQLKSLLLATGDSTIIYGDINDSFLGIGKRDEGENRMGNILMGIRNDIRVEGIVEPAIIKIPETKELVELLHNNEALKKWFDMRLDDALTSCKIFATYLENKTGRKQMLHSGLVDFIINRMYSNCMSIYEKNVSVYKMPESFVQKVKQLAKPYIIGNQIVSVRTTIVSENGEEIEKESEELIKSSAIEILWRYMSYLLAKLTDKFFALANTDEEITKGIDVMIKTYTQYQNIKCKGPFEDFEEFKNCVGDAIKHILRQTHMYCLDNNLTFNIGPEEIEMAIKIIYPKIEYEELKDTSSIDGITKMKMIITGLDKRQVSRKYSDYQLSDAEGARLNNFANYVMNLEGEDLTIGVSRVVFFSE